MRSGSRWGSQRSAQTAQRYNAMHWAPPGSKSTACTEGQQRNVRDLLGVEPRSFDLGSKSMSKALCPSSRQFPEQKSDAFIVARKWGNAHGAKGGTVNGPVYVVPRGLRRRTV